MTLEGKNEREFRPRAGPKKVLNEVQPGPFRSQKGEKRE